MASNKNFVNGQDFNIVGIAEWFHNLKHLNFKLESIKNTTFDTENKEYIESLIVFVSIPIVVLVLILLLYLIYSICICVCGTSGTNKKSIHNQNLLNLQLE